MVEKLIPTLELETELAAKGASSVAGIDEAGRGAWCGPVVAAAVILDPENVPAGLRDSKTLSEKRREHLFEVITANASVGVGQCTAEEIDELGIAPATMTAMQRAVADLPSPPAGAIIDGLFAPDLGDVLTMTAVKGDGRSLSVAAASIIAKVTRDRHLRVLDGECPGYGWAKNKGYGAKVHAEALAELGVTPHHRKTYAPVAARIDQN